MRKTALLVSIVATLSVILLGILQRILVAGTLSIFMFFRPNWWPNGRVLERVAALDGWHGTDRYPHAETVEGIVVYRWEAPLFFANAGIFRQQLRHPRAVTGLGGSCCNVRR